MASETPLKSSSYLLLGMIRTGVATGYAIKQAIEGMRMNVFWATTFQQIYPELAKLEAGGYIAGRPDPQGGRQRTVYSLTDSGEEAFGAWLRAAEQPPTEVRDEGLLRLAFADGLPREDALALVASLRERSERDGREFREQNVPMAEAVAQQGFRFALVLARMGAEYHAWAAEFFAKIERELGDPEGER